MALGAGKILVICTMQDEYTYINYNSEHPAWRLLAAEGQGKGASSVTSPNMYVCLLLQLGPIIKLSVEGEEVEDQVCIQDAISCLF